MELILAIDTSCDETSVAVTSGRKVISNIIVSQTALHAPFGGVYPTLAKREHESKLRPAIALALKRAYISMDQLSAIAVTFGPGLPPALEVGVRTAKELALEYNLPLIPVDHIEGHIYSVFAQNKNGNPPRTITFPFLALIVSGGHTELVLVNSHINYSVIGETLDDAAGEALDKTARMLGLGYPGGAALERVALQGDPTRFHFPIPMPQRHDLNFSYSGLKTAMMRTLSPMSEQEKIQNIPHLAASFQRTVVASLIKKLERAMQLHPTALVVLGGGVGQNKLLNSQFRSTVRKQGARSLTPPYRYLHGDNAAMIGIVAHYKLQHSMVLRTPEKIQKLDRVPRAHLDTWV